MRNRRGQYSPKKTLLITLLALSLAGLLLPREWTSGLISLVQIVVPFQHAAGAAADAVAGAFDSDGTTVSAEAHRLLQRRNGALEHRVAALAMRVAQLEEDVRILTATRVWGGDSGRLGARGSLVPARVVAGDILPWRSSRLISAGSLRGVRSGDAVTSQFFTIDQGDSAGVRDGMVILLGEALVGFVERTGTHTARVKLLSDASVQMKVRIGRLNGEGFTAVDRYHWLTGRGRDVMEIRDVDRRDVKNETIQIGDIVLSDPADNRLPAPMVIGKIADIKPDRGNPLLCILTVRSSVDFASLRRVYVFDPA